MMHSFLEATATVTIIIAAVTVAVAGAYRAFGQPERPGMVDAAPADAPVFLEEEDWQDVLSNGILIGDSSAEVIVAEFVDLECVFCRRSHTALKGVKSEYGEDLAYVFVHFPNVRHRFAMPAARAAECAGEQDRFGDFIDVALTKQDSLGLKSWSSYASEAGIQDSASFENCISLQGSLPRVEQGRELGSRLDITATPTVVINGWRLTRPPYDEFSGIIEDVLEEREPFIRTRRGTR